MGKRYKDNLRLVPHHKMGIKILDTAQLENLFPEYENIDRRINVHRKQIGKIKRKDNILDNQYNLMYDNVFSIMGKRGSGKTSVVLTLKQLLQDEYPQDIVLPIIMPEMIPRECSLIGWILSLFEDEVKKVNVKLEEHRIEDSGYFHDCMKSSKTKLMQKYEHVKELCFSQFYQVERAETLSAAVVNTQIQTQNSFAFSHELVEFWDVFVESIKKVGRDEREPIIYIIFDDVDLMPDVVISLLSTIIKYLSHPNIIVFLTADEDLLYDVVENHMNQKLGKYEELKAYSDVARSSGLLDKSSILDENGWIGKAIQQKVNVIREIPKLYGDKILPPSCRYYLRSFNSCEEKAKFVERVKYDNSQDEGKQILLEEYVAIEIDRYLAEIGMKQEANFVRYRDKYVNAYFRFWGNTSRQLANEALILQDFLDRLITLHNKANSISEDKRYYMKLHYIIEQFAYNTLISAWHSSMLSKEIQDLVKELIVYEEGGTAIYLNYSFLKDYTEDKIEGELNEKPQEIIEQSLTLLLLLFFIENILIIESKSCEQDENKRRSRIHGRGTLVSIIDDITQNNKSLVYRSCGKDFKSFLIFYEQVFDSIETVAKFDLGKARCVRNYFRLFNGLQFEKIQDIEEITSKDLEKYIRESPKWFRSMTQILYLSNEKIYEISEKQIARKWLRDLSTEVLDPYYEETIQELRSNLIETISNLYYSTEHNVEDDVDDKEVDSWEKLISWNNEYAKEELSDCDNLSVLKQKIERYGEICIVHENQLEWMIENEENCVGILEGWIEQVLGKLVISYNRFEYYSARETVLDEESNEPEDKLDKKTLLRDPEGRRIVWNGKYIDRKSMNTLCVELAGKIAKLTNMMEAKYWPVVDTSELMRLRELTQKYYDMLYIPLDTDTDKENAKEIIKCNIILKTLQKYYLKAYVSKGTCEKRIDLEENAYAKLYEAIKKELMKDEETYAKIEIKKYIRQGCEEYIERLWEE